MIRQASRELPAEFLRHLQALEAAYPRKGDPLRQSGFSGAQLQMARLAGIDA